MGPHTYSTAHEQSNALSTVSEAVGEQNAELLYVPMAVIDKLQFLSVPFLNACSSLLPWGSVQSAHSAEGGAPGAARYAVRGVDSFS